MPTYLDSADNEWFKLRLNRAVYLAVVAFLILFMRLFYLQVLSGDALRGLSESNSIRLQRIDPPRGLIFDRNADLLVDNRPSFDLRIVAKDAQPVGKTVKKLSSYLTIPYKELMAKIGRIKGVATYKPILLRTDIDRDLLAAFEVHKYDLPGVRVDVTAQRQYLNSKGAAHLIGYLGQINARELKKSQYTRYRSGEQIGRFGVEKTFENYLRGQRGGRQVEVDASGQIVRVLKTVSARPGRYVYLTIDKRLQAKAALLMNGRAGAVVAMDPRNGEILTMVSSPEYDQNAFVNGMSHEQWQALSTNPLSPMGNKAIQGEYPPASIYKIITAMAGLEEGLVDEKTTFFCPGYYKFGDREYRCWKESGHGKVNIVQALAESCDVYFYNLGQRLGIDRLAWYAKAFGLGAPTGFPLDTEAKGLVPTRGWKKRRFKEHWQEGETLSVAIGQSYNLVTPLQMAILISAVANGGLRHRPVILKAVTTAAGQRILAGESQIVGRIPASVKTIKIIQSGLFKAVNHQSGTAWGVHSDQTHINGKTGTAQVVARREVLDSGNDKNEYNLRPHAWFVGYGPSSSPRIAVAAIIEHGEHGSTAAAPIVMALIQAYLNNTTGKAE